MQPTSEQIRHVAYERWLRRGEVHGHDRPDWYAAEKELSFLLNYQTIVEHPLTAAGQVVLGDGPIRRCRFCEQTSGQTVFGGARAVVPGLAGRISLFSSEICDHCQADWRDPLDAEFRDFWEALHSDKPDSEAQGRAVFSVALYKSLIASVILILPETELPFVVDAIEWVSNTDHECDDRLFAGACCQVYFAEFLKDRPSISLARRVDPDAPLPYLVLFLGHGGALIQVHVPLCLRDEDLDGRAVDRPERALTAGDGPDLREARGVVLPLALPRWRSRIERRRTSITS